MTAFHITIYTILTVVDAHFGIDRLLPRPYLVMSASLTTVLIIIIPFPIFAGRNFTWCYMRAFGALRSTITSIVFDRSAELVAALQPKIM